MDEPDIRAIRHRLKLLRKTATEEWYENRDAVACPACSEPFDELLATGERARCLDPPAGVGICLFRGSERLFVFSHRS